ncbi:MetQ/NlpA family ABC transporter substrate-binding protein [Patulibacter brassicae]|uniref:MetQ/NlpA family ABC transporter substrate-binding protein n=1 Tax=Patulibacter brassicae TaxID=1705717 RepID=A0ABU4VGB7_9ACTN|nr:MetQ/NlpA family ABC transporter substrate-binding protein [Patulibacter brassicae]MDX8150749.1 MetQ/NlpA family ABC transporter substrate-binding protein [Patulibacter brassicae]
MSDPQTPATGEPVLPPSPSSGRRTAILGALAAVVVVVVAILLLTGGDDDSTPATATTARSSKPLVVGASPVPHAEILEHVAEDLAPKAGLKLEVKTYDDYVQPNVALEEGTLDANYFQHVPYLDAQKKENPEYDDLVSLAPVHLEPLGLYSKKVDDVADVPSGATVTLSDDPANQARGLRLLQQAGLLTLKPDAGDEATPRDVAENPKDLTFKAIAPANLPRTLDDSDLAVINGNYAIEAGLKPASDALLLEEAKGNPYSNLLVVRADRRDDPRIAKLEELLHSPEVKAFIERKYQGSVIPSS